MYFCKQFYNIDLKRLEQLPLNNLYINSLYNNYEKESPEVQLMLFELLLSQKEIENKGNFFNIF